MAHVSRNIMTFNSKLNEFWKCGKYCDIVIEVKGKSFNCHRLVLATASEYFDAMFGGNFSESKSNHIILDNIDALAFEEMLRFFYTGDAVITKENVYGLLHASDFFKLDNIEKLCNQFIGVNLPVPQLFKILSFASLTMNNSLKSILSEYIINEFDVLPHDDEFLKDLSFEGLNILASQHWHLSSGNSERFLSAVLAWLNYDCTTRNSYCKKLMEKIELQYIFTNCNSDSTFIEKYPDFKISKKCIPDLHVYMNFHDYMNVKVRSAKRSNLEWSKLRWIKEDTVKSLGCMKFDNHLYFLVEDVDSESAHLEDTEYTFYVSPSVDVFLSPEKRILKSPPGLLAADYINMCSVQNTIYISNASKSRFQIRRAVDASMSVFSWEQISQGIYAYNTEIDKWFAVPLLERELNLPYDVAKPITVVDNVLYLVKNVRATTHSKTPNEAGGVSILALDHRVSKWQVSSTFVDKQRIIRTDIGCGLHEGKIYVSSKNHLQNKTYEDGMLRYDVVSGKWETIEPVYEHQKFPDYPVVKLLSHGSYLWAFANGEKCPSIKVYNTYTQKWNSSPISGNIIPENKLEENSFLEAVAFKSL